MSTVTASVPRLERPPPAEFYRDYVARHRPAVLTGVADDWPARTLWTPSYFKAKFPGVRVAVEEWLGEPDEADPFDMIRSVRRRPMDLGDFIDVVTSGRRTKQLYLAQSNLLEMLPQLRAELGPVAAYFGASAAAPRAWRRFNAATPQFWLGPAGTNSPTHFDPQHNLLLQLYGRKRVVLFAPTCSAALYHPHFPLYDQPENRVFKHLNFSPVQVERPDYDRFPRFRDARPLEVVLGPGDMLFIPQHYWHAVRALEPSISVNFWWRTVPQVVAYLWRQVPVATRFELYKLRKRLQARTPRPAG